MIRRRGYLCSRRSCGRLSVDSKEVENDDEQNAQMTVFPEKLRKIQKWPRMIGTGGRAVAILMATLWKGKSVKGVEWGRKTGRTASKDQKNQGKKKKPSICWTSSWRRVRDLNPRWGISPHTISSRAP